MPPRPLLLALLALALLAAPGSAVAADYVPGQVIVKYRDGVSASAAAADVDGATPTATLPGGSQQLDITDGDSVGETVRELRRDPKVEYAVPNVIAHASFVPNDPGFARYQWNFAAQPSFGINMPEAWDLAAQMGAPGGRGALVAVLDSGVAYENRGRYRRAPDLRRRTFVKGYDFIDHDPHPDDVFGHGTHVTGTIAQATNNRLATAGIAYNAKIMPLRVLDSEGSGDSAAIARAIRYAAKHHVDVINLSLEFPSDVRSSEIPEVLSALRFAHRRGVVVVAAAGNQADETVAYPARANTVIAVGATTSNGCEAEYSNAGTDIDVVAPGGGFDANDDPAVPTDDVLCNHDTGRAIFQQTFTRGIRQFGLPSDYEGTSMASPHVAAIAALIIATKRLGPHPSPEAVAQHIEATAHDLGAPGWDTRYGWGLVDAAAALR
jgi:serine protease